MRFDIKTMLAPVALSIRSFVCHASCSLRKRFTRRGFTILEMLISAMLLAVCVVAALGGFAVAMKVDSNIEKSATALLLAKGEIELIKNASSWEAIDDFVSMRTNLGGEFADFDKEIVVNGDPKNVQVIIYWDFRGFEYTLELATLFTNYNY